MVSWYWFSKIKRPISSFRQRQFRYISSTKSGQKGEVTNPGTPSGVQVYGDATLTITSSKNNP